MNNAQQEYDSKADAIDAAHILSHELGMPAYAIEGRYGWHIGSRKPSLRYGKIIECYSGKEYHA